MTGLAHWMFIIKYNYYKVFLFPFSTHLFSSVLVSSVISPPILSSCSPAPLHATLLSSPLISLSPSLLLHFPLSSLLLSSSEWPTTLWTFCSSVCSSCLEPKGRGHLCAITLVPATRVVTSTAATSPSAAPCFPPVSLMVQPKSISITTCWPSYPMGCWTT